MSVVCPCCQAADAVAENSQAVLAMRYVTLLKSVQEQCQLETQNLMPPAVAASLPEMYTTGHDANSMAQVKWYTPDSTWSWFVIEYDPLERLAFGMVHDFQKELGYFTVEDIEEIRGPLGLKVERDLWFTPQPAIDCE